MFHRAACSRAVAHGSDRNCATSAPRSSVPMLGVRPVGDLATRSSCGSRLILATQRLMLDALTPNTSATRARGSPRPTASTTFRRKSLEYTLMHPIMPQGSTILPTAVGSSNEGLRIGVQLAANYGREDLLIRIASQLEEALPWSERMPRVHA